MIIIRFEIFLCLIALLTGVWFLAGAFRMKKLSDSRDTYLAQFFDMCDDDNIPLDILERFQNVFRIAHGYRAVTLLLQIFAARDKVRIPRAAPEIGRLPLDSSVRLGNAAFSLMRHISYYAPVVGFIFRNAFLGKQASGASTERGALLIAASERLSHIA